jgi:excisionase family DNA binding protein
MSDVRLVVGKPSRIPVTVIFDDGSTQDLTPAEAERVSVTLSDDEMLTPGEAAVLLAVSRPMVIRWVKEGLLTDAPVGAHHRIPRRAVLELKEQRLKAGREAMEMVRAAKTDRAIARQFSIATAAAFIHVAERDRQFSNYRDPGE